VETNTNRLHSPSAKPQSAAARPFPLLSLTRLRSQQCSDLLIFIASNSTRSSSHRIYSAFQIPRLSPRSDAHLLVSRYPVQNTTCSRPPRRTTESVPNAQRTPDRYSPVLSYHIHNGFDSIKRFILSAYIVSPEKQCSAAS